MTIQEILNKDESFRYGMLDRMKSDCDYYLGYGNHYAKQLWAGNEINQIAYMKAIWKSFDKDKKPEWLKYRQIVAYEKQMIG